MVKLEIIMKTLIYTVSQLDKNSIPYWIDFGTLLGACRNNELIVMMMIQIYVLI